MEQDILQIVQVTSLAPAALLFVWKVLMPLTNLVIARMNNTDTSSQARLNKIEGNDLHDLPDFKSMVTRRLDSIEDQVKDFSSFQKVCLDAQVKATEQFGRLQADIATLMERTKGK